MDEFKKAAHKHIGPGGVKCSCCNSRSTKELNRLQRKIFKREKPDLIEGVVPDPFWNQQPDPLQEKKESQTTQKWIQLSDLVLFEP